eukprot:SAG22_NODE_9276_length_599_cov_0.878000_1_plen_174_part_10
MSRPAYLQAPNCGKTGFKWLFDRFRTQWPFAWLLVVHGMIDAASRGYSREGAVYKLLKTKAAHRQDCSRLLRSHDQDCMLPENRGDSRSHLDRSISGCSCRCSVSLQLQDVGPAASPARRRRVAAGRARARCAAACGGRGYIAGVALVLARQQKEFGVVSASVAAEPPTSPRPN